MTHQPTTYVGNFAPEPATLIRRSLTDRTTCGSPVAKSPAGVGMDASWVEKNQGAPWAGQWIRDQISRAQRMNENTEGLL